MLGPDARQRAAGQNWAACMVMLPISIDAAAPITVDHSLQGAWQRTDDSQLFAICVDDATSLWPANCRSPHRLRGVGFGVGHGGSHPGISGGCLPAGGDRGVRVIDRPGSRGSHHPVSCRLAPDPMATALITGPDAITADSEYFNNCLTSPTDGTRRLTAPLRGLGDAAVPMG